MASHSANPAFNLATIAHSVLATVRQFPLWGVVLAVATIAFFANPGGYGDTSYALLHGLCAQTPSHTIHFGDHPLPFDARMTGIYGGFLVTFIGLACSGRLLHYGAMPKMVIATLVVLLLAMAADGFNSLLTDLGVWHPWTSTNAVRVITGYGVGVGLAVALAWLFASSTWHLSRPTVGVGAVRDLWFAAAGLGVYGALLIWSPGWLHLPVATLLVLSAWLVVTMLVLVTILLAFKLDERVRSFGRLHLPGAMAALFALSIMIGLGSFRFWVERTFGISNAFM